MVSSIAVKSGCDETITLNFLVAGVREGEHRGAVYSVLCCVSVFL